MDTSHPIAPDPERVRMLPNGIALVHTLAGDILVHSPPETLKFLLANGLRPPATILLPPDLPPHRQLGSSGFVFQGINYASVEFLMYANFFGAGGRRTRLITATSAQARRLRGLLEETHCGPSDPAAYGPYTWLQRECAAVSYYPPLGRSLSLDDMVDITSLEEGGGALGAVQVRLEDSQFVFSEQGVDVASVSAQITQLPMPLALTPPRPLIRQELTIQFLGSSDGFDPAGITTCFLAYLDPTAPLQATLFDAAAYLRLRLGNLGIAPSQISEIVLSHLHEDHLAGLPELILLGGRRVRLITSDIIYAGLLRVLSAMLAVSEGEVAALFDHYPLNPGQPLELEGRRFTAIYATHSVPTIAVRANGLCYSGDMRYDESWFDDLERKGVLAPARRSELTNFADGARVLVQDVGGGAVHSTLTPELLHALTAKSQRIILAHTSKHLMPTDQPDLADRVEFADSGHVVAIGAELPSPHDAERIATLSACPLFARLPLAERQALATQAVMTEWSDGQLIVREGDRSDGWTYIVHAGLVEIEAQGRSVRVLGRGSSIGERGALQGERRATTMVARGQVQLLSLSAALFHPIAERLGLDAAFARADWLGQLPVFAHLPWATLLDLALDFRPRAFGLDEALFACGELGDAGYLLVSGAVAIVTREGALIEEVSTPGEFFGGRAALYGTLRNASAYASEPSELWALPTEALQRLHMVYPDVVLHLRAIESARHGIVPGRSA